MQYDKSALTRRTLLSGATCLCVYGAYRALLAPPGPTPAAPDGSGAAARPSRSPSPSARGTGAAGARGAPDTYRMRPLAGGARMPRAERRLRRSAVPRKQAHLTLADPGRSIALTFDDGPHPVQTPAILRILRRHGTLATFFVIGENAEWNPDLVKAIEADGHLVANHSWSHPELPKISRARVRKELGRTCDLIEQAIGTAPRFARAPYGAWHAPSLQICAELGMEPMGWSVDTLDWKSPGTATIRRRVLNGAHPGAIVLAHDGGGDRSQTVAALAYYLPRLIERGYSLVPLAEPL
ncbi:polysaccharide deacetylase family protein [Streptomyces sp. P38-E01]|uniref:Polysaccharide deacetylase family protein n=1 Tax=Streptomyces tardus TaxID=2780544 RepID=A0A949JQM0_9ACTN|nr:polysaccharide deacetylase family protein [Streptomyces tardus]MBU7599461.1 polysaccharide deacetylase family protein [Streptomyces tardus]